MSKRRSNPSQTESFTASGEPEHWLILPDVHVPFECKFATEIVRRILADYKWTGVHQLGDFLDLGCVSRFNLNDLQKLSNGPSLADEYEAGRKLWGRWMDAGRLKNPDCKFEWSEGNHEARIRSYLQDKPQIAELLSIGHNFAELFNDGLKWIPNWKGEAAGVPRKFGHSTLVFHGLKHTKYHAAHMADQYSPYTVIYGHVHDQSLFSKKVFRGPGESAYAVGMSCGHLANPKQEYIGHRPTNWQQGFVELTVMPDGECYPRQIPIIGGRCVFRGKVYDVAKPESYKFLGRVEASPPRSRELPFRAPSSAGGLGSKATGAQGRPAPLSRIRDRSGWRSWGWDR